MPWGFLPGLVINKDYIAHWNYFDLDNFDVPMYLVLGSADIVRSCANSLAKDGKSDFMMNVGDGSCDEFLNTKSCRFDGGDCQLWHDLK